MLPGVFDVSLPLLLLSLQVHYGAGAYICGEETALIESLEGKQVSQAVSGAVRWGQ